MVLFKYDKEKMQDILDVTDDSSVYIPTEDIEMYFTCPMCGEFKEVRYGDIEYAIQGAESMCICQECYDKNSYIVPEKYSNLFRSMEEAYQKQKDFIMEIMDKEHQIQNIIDGKGE